VCGHAEDVHVIWAADATFDGWAHCTIGTGKSACTCWREWPRTPAESNDPLPAVAPLPDVDAAHDWRYVVRTVGTVFIATGLLLGGFVAYQLWGTGIEARRSQNALEEEFESLLTSVTSTTSAPTSTTPTSATGPRGTAPATVPETAPATVPDTVPAPVPPTIPPIAEGDPVARLEIPEIGLDVVVVAGVSVDDLKRGPGHYPGTPLPGQYGNAAIAGHRMTYDGPFQHVDDLEPGDQIVATTLAGRYVYEVTGTEIVAPDDVGVVATTNPDVAELTLTSCHPKWSTRERIVIHSTLVADESAAVGYAEGTAPTTTTPTPSTTIASAVTTTPATTAPTPTTPPASEAPSDATTTGPTIIAPTITPPSVEAFSGGWFHDRSAIPQVALWALVVAAIAVVAHVLSRRVGSRLVGIAVGIIPFLIALYFFYQNVNRLLPPSL
jgi:sortase A